MNQYVDRPRVAALLRKPMQENSTARMINGTVELVIDGDRVVVPAMETFAKLMAKVASIENRLSNLENKLNRVKRVE